MDLQRLQEDLEDDEGVVYEIYLDHLGLPTFGIGHLVREEDPEYGWDVGEPVSEERVAEVLHEKSELYEKMIDGLIDNVQDIDIDLLIND